MSPNEYIKQALRSEPEKYLFEAAGEATPRIEHAILGIASEGGELVDALKKKKLYGKEFDRVNLVEEMGDCMWYLALLSDALGVTFEEVWEKNIAKLRVRYPDKFSSERALDRDLDKERKKLEESLEK